MWIFLRAYLYWVVLWGFLGHKSLGLQALIPSLLQATDTLMISVTSIYVLTQWLIMPNPKDRNVVSTTGIGLIVVIFYGLGVTYMHEGSLIEGAKYLAVLARPLLLMLVLFILTRSTITPNATRLRRIRKLDFSLLVTAQLAVASLQLIYPDSGSEFIPVFAETQSAKWALVEGDVSGTFPNSIDLAYFLVAAYVVLTSEAWQFWRMPSLPLTVLLGYFTYATGSAAATVCFGVYASYLFIRRLSPKKRRDFYLVIFISAALVISWQINSITEIVIAKVENMMLSRLGLIFISLPEVFEFHPLMLLTGQGTDLAPIIVTLEKLPEVPLVFTVENSSVLINDVFWVSLLLTLGLPMMLLYLTSATLLFNGFLRYTRGGVPLRPMRNLLLLIIFVAGFINQIIVLRSFTTVLLLGLIPLVLSSTLPFRRDTPLPTLTPEIYS